MEDSGLIRFYHTISYCFYQWKNLSNTLPESQCDCHPRPTWTELSIKGMSRIFLADRRGPWLFQWTGDDPSVRLRKVLLKPSRSPLKSLEVTPTPRTASQTTRSSQATYPASNSFSSLTAHYPTTPTNATPACSHVFPQASHSIHSPAQYL